MSEKRKNKKKTILWISILAAVAVLALVVILVIVPNIRKNKVMAIKDGMMQNRQSTIALEKQDLISSISATGTIEAAKSRSVSASSNGMEVVKVCVSVGDTVKKGDQLVVFDTADLEDNLKEAKENLSDVTEEADDSISEAKEKLVKAKSEVTEAKNAVSETRKEYQKAKKAGRGEETQKKEAYSQAVSALEQKQEACEQAESQVKSAKKNKEKTIKEAKQKVTQAKKALEQCAVTAPIAGLVTQMSVEKGDMYAGGTIAQIQDVSSYMITTSVDEYDISSVKTGQRVVILTEATGDDELEGVITFVSPTKGSANMNGMNSGSDGYTVEISLKEADERLKLDMTAKCSIVLEEAKDVYAVPYDAVYEKEDGSRVIRVVDTDGRDMQQADGNYTEVTVTVGMETDYYVEISGEGLTEGMKVLMETETPDATDDKDETEFGFPGMQGAGGDMPGGQSMPGGGGDRGNGGGAPSMPGQ